MCKVPRMSDSSLQFPVPLPDYLANVLYIMDACQTCSVFFHISVSPHTDITQYERDFTFDERREIEESAQSCRLCRHILSGLGGHSWPEDYDQDTDHIPDSYDERLSIMTWVHASQFKVDENRISSLTWQVMENGMRMGWRPTTHCSVWADQSGFALDDSVETESKNTPFSGDFADWPPDINHSPVEIIRITQKLLSNCLENHEYCGLSVTQQHEAGELPSRVISIQDDGGVLSAKLVETKGLKGTYCALSHCWGAEDNHPPKTTRENIKHHLASIPWSYLPSTFRDALNLVSALGLQYIWIDSLCIIQDDKRDWEHEAVRMSSVYRKAFLVIAAVNSKDSTEGLVGPQLPLPIFRCPITVHNGPDQSIQQANMLPIPGGSNPSVEGPLQERAWAFQEWYLGRRIVFFTSKGVKWKCNEVELDTRGNFRDLGLYETFSWLHCLTYYSEKKLTVPSDRIIALHGIAEKLKEDRDDSFAAELGIWEHGLAEQLLWKHEGVPQHDFPGLPSWCWAATGRGKDWVTRNNSSHTMQNVSLGNSGSLDASGMLIKVTTPSSCLWECCLAEFSDVAAHEFCMRPGLCGETDNAERFLMLGDGGTRILGVGVFDDCEHTPECFCFVLTFVERDESDPFNYISESGSSGSEIAFPPRAGNQDSEFEKGDVGGSEGDSSEVHSTDGSDSAYPREDEHVCVDMSEVIKSSGVYWSLLLQPVDDTLTKFRRVGMALIWPRGLKEIDSDVKTFEIV